MDTSFLDRRKGMNYGYQIGQLKICVKTEEKIFITDDLDAFFNKNINTENATVQYALVYESGRRHLRGELVDRGVGYDIYSTADRFVYAFNVGTTINDYKAYLYMNPAVNRLILPEEHRKELERGFRLSNMLGIDQIFSETNHIVMHASVVNYKGQGILFTGLSGTGKSTQASLWEQHMGAEIINGDRAVLYVNDSITAYGSPYAGSSGIIRNVGVPVKAIILLEQANDNRIEHLNRKNAFRLLYGRFLLLKWDEKLCNLGLDMIQKILETVPAYRLMCRPDKDAVELVKKTLFGNTDIA